MFISRRVAILAFAAAAIIGAEAGAEAATLYQQPTNLFGGYYSENDTSPGGLGNYSTVFDNFTLVSTATVNSVSWVGNLPSGSNPVTGFTISIFGSTTASCAGGGSSCPTGSAIYSTHIAGDANQSFLQVDLLPPPFNNPAYAYSANVNFAATGGTEYWISIVADVAQVNAWAWESGTFGDGFSYQDQISRNLLAVDEAFALDDSPLSSTPEPTTITLIGGGLALLALAARRAKRG